MRKRFYYFLFLLCFFYLLVASILLFVGGFLLSRSAQPYKATCSIFSPKECAFEEANCFNDQIDELKYIHFKKQICMLSDYKVIILIIDGLRYDFTVYNEYLKDVLPYQNKLPIISSLLKSEPDKARLYEFIADPPTTTLQRLKGLTSGTLPTFIDAGSNFGTEEINEDNIIDQLIASKKRAIFMGDDTWIGLYPNRFLRSYPFPSFNVFDLDTVDNGVKEKLDSELKQKDWDLLIGHFLGVDHCGHRYGPLHSEMSRKLSEMNEVIYNITSNLSNNTILFVIGDHGMTMTGDHGGASEDEIKSAMFVYSKVPLISQYNSSTAVKQVDFVPTLATILGIPIPFSNLGSVILNTLPRVSTDNVGIAEWQNLLLPLWSNLQQMVHYIKEYSETSDVFDKNEIKAIDDKFAVVEKFMMKMKTKEDFEEFRKEAKEIMDFIFIICEEAWSQFDPYLMSRGLILFFLSIFLVYIIVDGIPLNRLTEIVTSSFIPVSYSAMMVVSSVTYILYSLFLIDNLLYSVLFSTGMIFVFMLAILIIQNWEIISTSWYERNKHKNLLDIVYRLILLSHAVVPLSNSFVIEESSVSYFLLTSVLFINFYECLYPDIKNSKSKLDKDSQRNLQNKLTSKAKVMIVTVIALFLLRLSMNLWRCREEQSWCTIFSAHHVMKSSTDLAKKYYVLTLVSLAVFVIMTRNWLRTCGNLKGFAPTITLFRYAPSVMVACTGCYWILQKMSQKQLKRLLYFSQPIYFAWAVYAAACLLVISAIVKPLCLYIVPKKREQVVEGKHSVPHLFHQIKEIFGYDKEGNNPSNVPIIYGLATIYSAPFVVITTAFCLLLGLLLGSTYTSSIVFMYFFAAFVLLITTILRYNKAQSKEDLFQIPSFVLLAWMLISHYFFYGTGHQPTFPNIPWEAGFVGNSGDFTNYIIPATLIIVNIFGSYILIGFAVPLLIIAPFTVKAVLPNFLTKKHNIDFANGEIYLYENEEYLLNGVFVASCKYALFHGVQVFLSMMAATIHCRHLMVWKIFAPKLIFSCIAMFITLASILMGYLFLINVNYKVGKFISRLNKDR